MCRVQFSFKSEEPGKLAPVLRMDPGLGSDKHHPVSGHGTQTLNEEKKASVPLHSTAPPPAAGAPGPHYPQADRVRAEGPSKARATPKRVLSRCPITFQVFVVGKFKFSWASLPFCLFGDSLVVFIKEHTHTGRGVQSPLQGLHQHTPYHAPPTPS